MGPTVLRVNARTFPIRAEECRWLNSVNAEIIEVEVAEECSQLDRIDAVMIASAYLKADIIKKMTRCKLISRMGNGCDKIDIPQATAQKIMLANVPDASTSEVADHTLALLLSAARKLKFYEGQMRSGQRPFDTSGVRRLSTQTLGVFGFGLIGRAVVERAKVFGFRIIVSDPALTPEIATKYGVIPVDKDTLLAESDYVCLLCPLLPSTRRMIGAAEFGKMKKTAVLINTARGELVDEPAMAEAVKNGIIGGAGIDVYGDVNVFATGGFNCDHPMFGAENIQMTPHVAANSEESLEEIHTRAAQAVADVFSGREPEHSVNGLRVSDLKF